MQTKVCTKCERNLPIEVFSKNKYSKDGLQYLCKECRRDTNKQHYEKNKEKILKRTKEYYQEHIEEYKKWHEEHKEQKTEYKKKWEAENPGKVKIHRERANKKYWIMHKEIKMEVNKKYNITHRKEINQRQLLYLKSEKGKETERRRQCRRRAIEGQYSQEQWQECLIFFNNSCAYTGESLINAKWHVDHIKPISKGGSSYIWNLCPSVDYANMSKHNKYLEEWYRKQPYFSQERLDKIYEWIEYAKNKYTDNEKVI